MDFKEGPFLKSDAKRLKRIKSLVDDVKAHHQFLKGKLWELKNSPQYFIPTAKATFFDEVFENGQRTQVCKFRQVTTNPRSDKSGGLRILAVLVYENVDPIKYIPLLIYSAQEEKSSVVCDGKAYKMSKSGIASLIKYRLEIYGKTGLYLS